MTNDRHSRHSFSKQCSQIVNHFIWLSLYLKYSHYILHKWFYNISRFPDSSHREWFQRNHVSLIYSRITWSWNDREIGGKLKVRNFLRSCCFDNAVAQLGSMYKQIAEWKLEILTSWFYTYMCVADTARVYKVTRIKTWFINFFRYYSNSFWFLPSSSLCRVNSCSLAALDIGVKRGCGGKKYPCENSFIPNFISIDFCVSRIKRIKVLLQNAFAQYQSTKFE